MKSFDAYSNSFEHILISLKKLFSTLQGFSIISVVSFVIALSSIQRAIIALGLVFMLDWITGCLASWIEHKKNNTSIAVYFFETSKARLSVAKAISYGILILLSWLFTALFFDKKLDLVLSTRQYSIVELTVGVCIAIESWSNIENLKRAGFDVVGQFATLMKNIWKIKDSLNNKKDETTN
jgi:hypothetical protein